MSKRKKNITENIAAEDRDYKFQKLISQKNETYLLLDGIRKEISVDDYSDQKWFTKQLKEIDGEKLKIVNVLSETNIKLKYQGVWRHLTNLTERHNWSPETGFASIFAEYLDSYIARPTESQLEDLYDGHHKINDLLRSLIGSIEYDQASHG